MRSYIDKQSLKEQAQAFELMLSEKQLEDFDLYAKTIVEWNAKINLTAIIKPEEMVVKHFLDSLITLKAITVPQNAKVIDVGTGAGFPSMPMKIVREDLQVTLLDSLNKKVTFLKEASTVLKQNNDAIHFRAEEASKKPEYREQYDIATARAVADLRELVEYCLPFVKVGGYFIALKGYDVEQELEQAQSAIGVLGGELEAVKKFILPLENKRSIIIIKKISQTSTKYPRISGKITKKPL